MEIDNMGDIFNEYKVLSNQLKEKEQLYDILLKKSEELDSKYDLSLSKFICSEKELNKKKEEIYFSKDDYISKKDKIHSKNVFGLSFLIPYISGVIFSLLNIYSITFWQLVINSLIVSLAIGGVEGALSAKKNVRKFSKEYYETDEYKKLKSELDKLEEEFKQKLNEYNSVIIEIDANSNEMDNVKKEFNEIKYRLSRLVSDTFRTMYEAYGFEDEENHEEAYELRRRNTYDGNF